MECISTHETHPNRKNIRKYIKIENKRNKEIAKQYLLLDVVRHVNYSRIPSSRKRGTRCVPQVIQCDILSVFESSNNYSKVEYYEWICLCIVISYVKKKIWWWIYIRSQMRRRSSVLRQISQISDTSELISANLLCIHSLKYGRTP